MEDHKSCSELPTGAYSRQSSLSLTCLKDQRCPDSYFLTVVGGLNKLCQREKMPLGSTQAQPLYSDGNWTIYLPQHMHLLFHIPKQNFEASPTTSAPPHPQRMKYQQKPSERIFLIFPPPNLPVFLHLNLHSLHC